MKANSFQWASRLIQWTGPGTRCACSWTCGVPGMQGGNGSQIHAYYMHATIIHNINSH